MDAEQVSRVRSFSRTTTERVGALRDDFMGRGRPLGLARLLWEVGVDGVDVRDLRARLGLDSGYVSRSLRALERDGLLTVAPSDTDARVRRATLTPRGLDERAELDARSDAHAASLLEPLSEHRRAELVTAMETVERLLTASLVSIAVEDPRAADGRTCLDRYFREIDERFEAGFDPVHDPVADEAITPPAGLFLVARLRGEPVGCGGLALHDGGPAEIRRMWVAPSVRGLGLGRRLLRELEDRARSHGAPAVRLETNRSLREAISLYRQSGYREIEPFNDMRYADFWFEKRL
jgi:DNA-binding MarR family transcriptional regulator/GNAT superfamily N-acetyltransferase